MISRRMAYVYWNSLSPISGFAAGSFAKEWESTFGQVQTQKDSSATVETDLLGGPFQDVALIEGPQAAKDESRLILPSQLLNQQLAGLNAFGEMADNATFGAMLRPAQAAQPVCHSSIFSFSQVKNIPSDLHIIWPRVVNAWMLFVGL